MTEWLALCPHSMHDHRQFSGYGHLCFPRSCFSCQGKSPLSQIRFLPRSCEQSMRRLKQQRSEHGVATFRNSPIAVDFARLVAARRQPKIRPYIRRSVKPLRCVNRCHLRCRGDCSHAGDPNHMRGPFPNHVCNRFRTGAAFPLPHPIALAVDHADGGLFQRNIQPNVVFHRIHLSRNVDLH